MTVTANSDAVKWVYGFPDYKPQGYNNSCVGATGKGTVSDTRIVWSTGSGKSDIAGVYTSLSGYYVGFGGSRTIDFNKSYLARDQYRIYHDGFTGEEVEMFPKECAVSDELT